MKASHVLAAVVALGAMSLEMAQFSPAHALSMSECSAKYQAAKTAGTLNGMKWNDFRKTQCGADASAAPAATSAPAPAAAPAPKPTPAAAPAKPAATPAPAAAGSPIFPRAVSPKYATESPGKQRFHTCLDQYNANKASGGNAGLKWIEKGGGYYSQCNKQLKG